MTALTKLCLVLVMLFSIAGGPAAVSSGSCAVTTGDCARCAEKASCHMACCCQKLPVDEKSAPAPRPAGQESAVIASAPFTVLFKIAPVAVKRAPRALLAAAGHAPEPLAASCIQLI